MSQLHTFPNLAFPLALAVVVSSRLCVFTVSFLIPISESQSHPESAVTKWNELCVYESGLTENLNGLCAKP